MAAAAAAQQRLDRRVAGAMTAAQALVYVRTAREVNSASEHASSLLLIGLFLAFVAIARLLPPAAWARHR